MLKKFVVISTTGEKSTTYALSWTEAKKHLFPGFDILPEESDDDEFSSVRLTEDGCREVTRKHHAK